MVRKPNKEILKDSGSVSQRQIIKILCKVVLCIVKGIDKRPSALLVVLNHLRI